MLIEDSLPRLRPPVRARFVSGQPACQLAHLVAIMQLPSVLCSSRAIIERLAPVVEEWRARLGGCPGVGPTPIWLEPGGLLKALSVSQQTQI